MNVRYAFDCAACSLRLTVVALAVFSVDHAEAATHYYLDLNGTTTGSGVVDGGTYSWENAIWNLTAAGTTTTPTVWPADGNAFPQFAAGTDANNKSYTITASSNHTFAGMALQTSGGGNGAGRAVTIAGAPGVVLSLFSNSGGQGIFVGGTADQNLIISVAISGDAVTPVVWQGPLSGVAGSLYLYGDNLFSGGLDLNTTGALNFNNANSFGSGPIRWGFNVSSGTAFALAAPALAVPITIANPMQTKSASTLTMASFAKPVTWSGGWTLATGTSTLGVQTGVDTTISGPISGTDVTSALMKTAVGKLTLSSANTYAGGTTVAGGTLEVSGASANLGTGNVFVTGNGTSLAIDSGVTNALSNTATVNLSGFATMSLGAGINDRVSALILDGAQQPNGTYGSSQSNAVNKLDFYFSGKGILTVGPSILAGDFNNDGVVSSADYVAWQNNVGQPSQTLPNDTTGVIVGTAQYNLWRTTFGNTIPAPGAGSSLDSASVPEPSTIGLLLISFVVAGFRRKSAI